MSHTAIKDRARARALFTGEPYALAKLATGHTRSGIGRLVPDASSRHQAALEADLLTAIVGGPDQKPWWPEDRPILIEAVTPYPDSLDIVVAPEHLGLLCWRIMGKPGSFVPVGFGPIVDLGVMRDGKNTILYRRGTSTRVRLRGHSWKRWISAVDEANSMKPIENSITTRIAPQWRNTNSDTRFEHTATASMLLRRAGLFRDPGQPAQWIRSGTHHDGRTWEWLAEPPHRLNVLLISSGLASQATASLGHTHSAPTNVVEKRYDTHSRRSAARDPVSAAISAFFRNLAGNRPPQQLLERLPARLASPVVFSASAIRNTEHWTSRTTHANGTERALVSVDCDLEVDGKFSGDPTDLEYDNLRLLAPGMALWERSASSVFEATRTETDGAWSVQLLAVAEVR